MQDTSAKIRYPEFIFILITAFTTILICSKSSPLYPINDWTDANCYMTVGRAMLKGAMPYRDLFEHKGPVIYLLHALAATVSDDSFFGVFLIEAAFCSWFLWLSYKILLFKCKSRHIWAIPLTAAVIYASKAFCHGDSAEEFCMPLVLCSYFIGLKVFCGKNELSDRDSFFIGILSGIILWTKFTLLGFYAGFFLAAVFFYRKNIIKLVRMCSLIILGVGAVSIPIIIFFAANDSLQSLFEVYFYDNLFVYSGMEEKSSLLENLKNGFVFTYSFMPIGFTAISIGILTAAIQKNRTDLTYTVITMLTAFLFVFAGHLSYRYYPLILAAFVPVSIAFIILFAEKRVKKIKLPTIICSGTAFTVCVGSCFLLCPNIYLMKYKKNELPQYQFAEIINQTENPTLLNYDFLDGGFYLASGIVPQFKYFCRNNTGLETMLSGQQYYVENGIPDYIVARSSDGNKPSFSNYTFVAESEFSYYEKNFYYYLYKRNPDS